MHIQDEKYVSKMLMFNFYVVVCDELSLELLAVGFAGRCLATCASAPAAEVDQLHHHFWRLV